MKKPYIKPCIMDFYLPVARAQSCAAGFVDMGPDAGCGQGDTADACGVGLVGSFAIGCVNGVGDVDGCIPGSSALPNDCTNGFSAVD